MGGRSKRITNSPFSTQELHFVATSLTGAAATVAHDLFITPADVLKQRMQLDRR